MKLIVMIAVGYLTWGNWVPFALLLVAILLFWPAKSRDRYRAVRPYAVDANVKTTNEIVKVLEAELRE